MKSHPHRRWWLGWAKTAVVIGCVLLLVNASSAAEPASSARSTKAISKVKPALVKELNAQNLSWGSPVYLRLVKQERELELWLKRGSTYTLFKTYPICTFSGTLGPKLAEGDLQAPEGFYTITADLMNPWSSFHLSFNIGYPNRYDRAHKRTGSYIMVHGNCVSTGCFAMTDPYIEEIYALVDAAFRAGAKRVPIHVFPFRLSAENLAAQQTSPWHAFWTDLQVGWDFFETKRVPPLMKVRQGRYRLAN